MGYIISNATVERRGNIYSCCSSDGIANIDDVVTIELSHDLGDTTFAEIKGSDLNRWISKAIKNGEFIKVV
jgi:hypothetical protein